jgi:hypothetical protein
MRVRYEINSCSSVEVISDSRSLGARRRRQAGTVSRCLLVHRNIVCCRIRVASGNLVGSKLIRFAIAVEYAVSEEAKRLASASASITSAERLFRAEMC